MFMLNSFTNGLFGGANDVFSLATKFQDLRTKFGDWGNANEIERAMQTGPNDSGTGGLYGSSTPTTDATRPSGNSFDDDPALAGMPPLKRPEALKLSTNSPLEAKG